MHGKYDYKKNPPLSLLLIFITKNIDFILKYAWNITICSFIQVPSPLCFKGRSCLIISHSYIAQTSPFLNKFTLGSFGLTTKELFSTVWAFGCTMEWWKWDGILFYKHYLYSQKCRKFMNVSPNLPKDQLWFSRFPINCYHYQLFEALGDRARQEGTNLM